MLGFALAIALLGLGGVVIARYFITKLTTPPPRPTFANDKPAATKAAVAAKSGTSGNTAAPQDDSSASPTPALEPGTYQARVVQPIGLILRDGPGSNSNQIGGIEYNSRVVVLEESPDKVWQRVRLENSDRVGWVKAGNTERIN
ncbi:MAG TPA: SH3 domain-containing protein [Candidatus Obscuribacterales bacterium]